METAPTTLSPRMRSTGHITIGHSGVSDIYLANTKIRVDLIKSLPSLRINMINRKDED